MAIIWLSRLKSVLLPTNGVRPYEISTIVDKQIFLVDLKSGVRPYEISTIVDGTAYITMNVMV